MNAVRNSCRENARRVRRLRAGLAGCAATGETESDVIAAIREGIEIYIQELKARGESVPEPISKCTQVEVRV